MKSWIGGKSKAACCLWIHLTVVVQHCYANAEPSLQGAKGTNLLARRTAGNTGSSVPDDANPLLVAIKASAMLLEHAERMTAHFLEVAYPINKEKNKKYMKDVIKYYDETINDLINGNPSKKIPVPANEALKKELEEAKLTWASYKTLLETEVDSVKSTSSYVLQKIHKQSKAVAQKSEQILDKYTAAAMLDGIEEDPVKVYARRQLLYLDGIFMDTLFVALNVEKDYYLGAMASGEVKLEDVEQALVYGNAVANVPELAQVCILQEMLKVDALWENYREYLGQVHDAKSISKTLLLDLLPVGENLHHEMAIALELFEHDDGICDVVSQNTDKEWSNMIEETNTQRRYSQKVVRLFLQKAKGLQTYDTLAITQALTDAQKSLRKCMKGSHRDHIPSPPSQKVVDELMSTWDKWKVMDEEIRTSLTSNTFSSRVVKEVAAQGKAISENMRTVGNMCVRISLQIRPNLRSVIWEISERQGTLLQKMSTDALLVSLGDSVDQHKAYVVEEAADPLLVNTLLEFKSAWEAYRPTNKERMVGLIDAYITTNPHPTGEKDKLDKADGNEQYHAVHLKYHPKYRDILYDRNYYDIFMLDIQGNLIYSVFKELDFATNFAVNGDGEWKDSGLGEAYEAAMANPDEISVIDWKPYGPSNGALASFLSTGVKDETGRIVGVFCSQMPPESSPAEFQHTLKAFEGSHWELLKGRSAADASADASSLQVVLYQDKPLPRTTHACTLTTMASVLSHVTKLKVPMLQLVENQFQSSELADIRKYTVEAAADPVLVDALVEFKVAWDAFRTTDDERRLGLQAAYITLNQHPTGEKDKLYVASGTEAYHAIHEKYHPKYRDMLYARNFYDIFMLDLQGNLIYSVYKELDYATNFAANGNGEWKDSGLGEAFEAAMASPDIITVIDWKPYGPSNGALASFLSTGIKDKEGQMVGVFSTQMPPDAKLTTIAEVDSLATLATNAMEAAVDYYKDGQGTCATTLSETEWEVLLQQGGYIPYLIRKSMTEYFLLAGGYSQKWVAAAEAALIAQEGYTMEEAADPVMAEAIVDFKRGWDTYKETDEERSLGLQASYITLNQYPTGEKDKLDMAAGNEEYHQIHLKYHPKYRDILYNRNYYDIFMLDLEGNLIYSVYKELDYATNFASDGNGKWKNSGLGEAFVASMANPDTISVIDWKPYGPSYGALASFLSIGVRNAAYKLVGVYSTQMHPDSRPIDSVQLLNHDLDTLDKAFVDFKFGNPSAVISTPPNQAIAGKLFAMSDEWDIVTPILHKTPDDAGVKTIAEHDKALHDFSVGLLQSYVDGAASGAPSLKGTIVSMVGTQLEIVQTMCEHAVLIGMGNDKVTRGDLTKEINLFESNQALLLNGGRRLAAQGSVEQVTDSFVVGLLESMFAADGAWPSLKTTLQGIADGGEASESVLRNVVASTSGVVKSMDEAFTYLATTTRTTTLMTLEILAPMPFQGDWSGGATMKVSSLLAEGLINEQQIILPGYSIKSVFFDDMCDPVKSSEIVLGEMATKDTYIALGGSGCTRVCQDTAFAASTIRLPYLSYECAGSSLSDESTYPEITRFGTVSDDYAGSAAMADDVINVIGKNFSWPDITIISGDPSKYDQEAKGIGDQLNSKGFQTESVYSFENDWNQILSMMTGLREESKGKMRVYYLIGTEDYFRKVVCASLVAKAAMGITWLSRGTWIDQWWKHSDKLAEQHEKWLMEDSGGAELKAAIADFKQTWDDYIPGGTDKARGEALYDLYFTKNPDRENLDVAAGPEQYHVVHQKWHPKYRQTLYDRKYYDIFMFDLRGNLIYSVYKESDYATNFAANGNGEWKDSGLGDAYRAAKENPDVVTYIDWKPYGPSAGALAAFLSTGVKNEDGELIGVYTIQLPPEYQRSVEQTQPECTLQKITESFEGAINIRGLGRPVDENMMKPMTCFEGHSPQSFLQLLDEHLLNGYPMGDRATQVPSPYGAIKANAADAICAIAFTVRALLDQGNPIENIQKPNAELYAKFLEHLKTKVDFQGASGRVKFSGNDRPHYLLVEQVQQGKSVDVGLVSPEKKDSNGDVTGGDMEWTNGGPDGSNWKAEPQEPAAADNFPYWVLNVFVPIFLCISPVLAGAISGWRASRGELAKLT